MTAESWNLLLKSLVEMMKPVYVEPNKYIFDPNAPGSSKWCGLMLLRHGEVGGGERVECRGTTS